MATHQLENPNPMKLVGSLAINEEGFAFNPNTGESYLLNDPASSLLKQLQCEIDTTALVTTLCSTYDVSYEQAYIDVIEFIDTLKSHQLIDA